MEEYKMNCCSDEMETVNADSCCTPRDTAQQASTVMRQTGCGCSPGVRDKESRKPAFPTERTIIWFLRLGGAHHRHVVVAQLALADLASAVVRRRRHPFGCRRILCHLRSSG